MTNATDTIDITALVDNMKKTWVLVAKQFIINAALAAPGIGVVAAWFIKTLFSPFIDWSLTKLSDSALMEGFFLETALRKNAQAKDYVDLRMQKLSLPLNTSEADYAKAEQAEMQAFLNFVAVTN